jgi:PBSX family phage portal protein
MMGADGDDHEHIDATLPREVLVKAYAIGTDRVSLDKADQQSDESVVTTVFGYASLKIDALEPPYDPERLCRVYEHSSSLRQNVDAYKTNIDGFGHVFEPMIQLKEAGARELVSDAMYLEKADRAQQGIEGSLQDFMPPTDEEVTTKIDALKSVMRVEEARIKSFFQSCVAEESFTSLRRKTREDIEVTGNGYWEVIRNDAGEISQFVHMPSRSMRVTREKGKPASVTQQVRTGLFTFRTETFKRRFRRYVQSSGEDSRYFKEFGDPVIVSSKTGREFATLEELQTAEAGVDAANEVFQFKIHSVKNGAYGVPRWIGNLLSVLGSRSAEEVNLAYFNNKSVPPMAILVSGGRLGEESVKRIEDFVETKLKGTSNFHKILVIEAETTAGSLGMAENTGSMRVEIKTLTDAQLKDGLFLQYDAANMDKVGMGFRLPRLLRGDIRDFNRASAEAALDFAESQVFVPERNDFDFAMNRFILPCFGIKYWTFKSNGPRLSDAQSWSDMIVKNTTAGIFTPEDARELTGKKVLGTELPKIEADWVKQPLALSIAGIQADTVLDGEIPKIDATGSVAGGVNADPNVGISIGDPSIAKRAKSILTRKAKSLLKLRDEFFKQEAEEAVANYKRERAAEQVASGELVIKMTAEDMAAQFGITKVP